MYEITKTDEEIDNVLNAAVALADSRENPYFGMTYAQGVEVGIQWVVGQCFEEDGPPLS